MPKSRPLRTQEQRTQAMLQDCRRRLAVARWREIWVHMFEAARREAEGEARRGAEEEARREAEAQASWSGDEIAVRLG